MYTAYTYKDWLEATEAERPELARQIVADYMASAEYRQGAEADRYFGGDNAAVAQKTVTAPHAVTTTDSDGRKRTATRMEAIIGNRVGSNYLFRGLVQLNQYLLGNGVTLDTTETKERLGFGFDSALQQMGEKALLHGVCWGYWNMDHVEVLPAVTDGGGFVALLDDLTGEPMVGLHFWRLSSDRPQYIRCFEADGLTLWRVDKDGVKVAEEKRAYKLRRYTDGVGSVITGAENYGSLPVVPFYGNPQKASELTPAIKSKIDLFDRILSDFGDNLDRANDVYWVLNNFGGSIDEVAQMLEEIRKIKAVVNITDGVGGGSTAEAKTIEVPYEARRTALELLRREIFADMMVLDMDTLTGGSLTNVAIQAATTNLNLKADRFEWQAFAFVQGVLKLIGVETEEISFQRQSIVNKSEIVQDIYMMRSDIDHRTALKLNPYIMQDEIDGIVDDLAAEQLTGQPSMEDLQSIVDGD